MNKEEKTAAEIAFENFQEELRKAIFNEEIEMSFSICSNKAYIAKVEILWKIPFSLAIAEDFVCYHNDFTKGLFDNKQDFKAFKDIVKKHFRPLTSEEKERIAELEREIENIKNRI